MFPALVIISSALALAESQYHYQQPSGFQLPNQQYIPGRPPDTIQYAQASQNSLPQNSNHWQNVQNGPFSSNQVAYQRPVSTGYNYQQSYGHNSASSQNFQQTNQNSVNLNANQNNINVNTNQNNINVNTNKNGINLNAVVAPPVQPVVMKHIYFHAPPPDVEASVASASIKRKKTYNIVFIKVPEQPKYYINAQGFKTYPHVPVEDKTVIYVLVKKPENLSQERAKSPPNHEVYYVKYKGNANGAATQITNQLSNAKVQSLQPGLANGQH